MTQSVNQLAALWTARSVAVIGASDRPNSIGRLPVQYLQRYGYAGEIFPVNPTADTVAGLRCYPTVADVDADIELALILVNASRAEAAVQECADARVPVSIVMSGGFAETGEDGEALQRRLVERARAGGMRLLGPNCIGAVNFHTRLMATFTPLFSGEVVPFDPGGIAFVSQSGAIGYGVVSLALERGLPLGWVATTGNEADVSAIEALLALAELPECTSLLAYVEQLTDREGLEALAATGKPFAVVKAGDSAAGARAAMSHTGALSGEARVIETALRQMGIARVTDLDELLDVAEVAYHTKALGGRRVAVITTSGGSGILAADALEAKGLELATLSEETEALLRDAIPPFGSPVNPVDVTASVMADPALFRSCLKAMEADPGVDAVVACFCVLTGNVADDVVAGIAEVATASDKPLVVARTGADFLAPSARRTLQSVGVPLFPTPLRAVGALAGLWRTQCGTLRSRPVPPKGQAPAHGVTEPQLKAVLSQAGLRVPAGTVVRSAEDAAAVARSLGGRVVMKAVVTGLVHKTEVGGVRVDVPLDEVGRVFDELARLGGEVLVEEQVEGGVEMLVGAIGSPLGAVVTVGTGGVLSEVLDDVAMRLAPVAHREAEAMVGELRASALLRGVRGRAAVDAGALADVVMRVSELVFGWPQGFELDLNPVVVRPDGAWILDAAYIAAPSDQHHG